MLSVLQFLEQFQLFEVEVVNNKLVGSMTRKVDVKARLELSAGLMTSHFQRMLHNREECLRADVTIEQELLGCLCDFATQDDGLSVRIIGDKSVYFVLQLAWDA
jgi:hypothetical protein